MNLDGPHSRRFSAAHVSGSTASAWRDDSRATAFALMSEPEWILYVGRFGLAGVPALFTRQSVVSDAMGLILAEGENEVWAGREPERLVLDARRKTA